MIPVISYFRLRGRCRDCWAPVPKRVPLVEAVTAALFGLLGWHYGPGAEMALAWFFAAVMLVIFVIDLEHQLTPNVIVYPSILLAFLVPWLTPGLDFKWALIRAGAGAGLLLPIALFSRRSGYGGCQTGGADGGAAGLSPGLRDALRGYRHRRRHHDHFTGDAKTWA